MSVYYKIDGVRLHLGPTNIVETSPTSGVFEPSRGRQINFPAVFLNAGGDIINRDEKWQWDLVIEGSPIYLQLKEISYSGTFHIFESSFGLTDAIRAYSGEIKDLTFELRDELTFNNGKKGYKVVMPVNAY